MEEKKEMIKVINEEGNEVEVEIIAYFTLKSNNKQYLIYTENKMDANGNVEVYTSEVMKQEDGSTILAGIEDDGVWTEIKKLMIDIAKGE